MGANHARHHHADRWTPSDSPTFAALPTRSTPPYRPPACRDFFKFSGRVKVKKKTLKKEENQEKKEPVEGSELVSGLQEVELDVQKDEISDGQANEEVSKKVYVGGIPYYSTEDDIRSFFDHCGTITKVDCMKFPETGKFRGIAILNFKPIELWTGKQLFNVLLRPNTGMRVYVNLMVREKNYSKPDDRESNCREETMDLFIFAIVN